MQELRFPSVLEITWTTVSTAVTVWSLLAVGLAELGQFHWWTVLVTALLAVGVGWASWRTTFSGLHAKRREILFLLLLIVVGFALFARPSQHVPQLGDSSIYPNTASKLIDTGGLAYHYDPLDGLSTEQKELFYVPADEQLSYTEIESYEGLLYGAFYVTDTVQNTIVASRPPLAISWMALFGLLGGPAAMFYVAPLFGIGSLIVVYFLGKRLFDSGVGALAALWLLISFPQIRFSRAPYAEIVGQFFVLLTLYAVVSYLQKKRVRYITLAMAAFAAGFSARLDLILLIPVLFLFALFLLLRRDGKGLAVWAASLTGGVGFTLWTVNKPYVGATSELMFLAQLRFLRQLTPFILVGIGLTAALGLLVLREVLRRLSPRQRESLIRWGVVLLVAGGVGYALHVRPLRPEYVAVGEEMFRTHNEELMAVAAQYMGYLFFWLAAFGMTLLFWRGRISEDQILFAFLVAFSGTGFFWKYTTARVYPVALRRLVPQVLPGCALLAAHALRRVARWGRLWRGGAAISAGLVAVLLVSLSGPYWFHQGALGAWETLEELADRVPADSVVLFEPQQEGAIVGWFAAPLWSFYDRDALLLNVGGLDAQALQGALDHWQQQGKPVYVVSQRDPLSWWPGDFHARKEGEISWTSSIIGQSLRFPPHIWRFSFTFSIYHWGGLLGRGGGGFERAGSPGVPATAPHTPAGDRLLAAR